MAKPDLILEWDAPEHEHKERRADWFWAAGIIVVAIALVSIIFGNIIFAILVIVASFSLTLFINKVPQDIHVAVSTLGIQKGNTLYPIDTLEAFWIDLEHPHKKIIIRSKKPLMPLIIVPVADKTNVDKLRETLLTNIPEEYMDLPFVEKVLEYLGF